jgi:hypothetical protein
MSAYIWVKYDGSKFIESATLGNTSSESTQTLINNLSTQPFMIKISKVLANTNNTDTVVSLDNNNFKLELDALQGTIIKNDCLPLDDAFFKAMHSNNDSNITTTTTVSGYDNNKSNNNSNNNSNSNSNNNSNNDNNNTSNNQETDVGEEKETDAGEEKETDAGEEKETDAGEEKETTNKRPYEGNNNRIGGAPRTKKHRNRSNHKNTHRNYFIFKPRA